MELKIQDIYKDSIIKSPQNIPNIPSIPTQVKQNVALQKQKIENNKIITSYDNILSSLNMQVVDGKLQIVRTVDNTKNTNNANNNTNNTKDTNAKKVSFQNHTQNPVVQKHTPQQLRQHQLQLQQERMQNYKNQNQNKNQNNVRNIASPWQQEINMNENTNENLVREEIPIFDEDPNYFPMTKQEIKRMLAIQYLKNMQEKRKLEMLKPKKMNFL